MSKFFVWFFIVLSVLTIMAVHVKLFTTTTTINRCVERYIIDNNNLVLDNAGQMPVVKLELFTRMTTPERSIFYSFILLDAGVLFGFARKSYDQSGLLTIKCNEKFEIANIYDENMIGEDPRVFHHDGCVYVVDNRHDNVHLHNYTKKTYVRVNLDGKNFSFVSRGRDFYCIHTMQPFRLFKVDVSDGAVQPVYTVGGETVDNTLRGGTPGYIVNSYRGGTPGYMYDAKKYYGFGHRTYQKSDDILRHDIYFWVLLFDDDDQVIRLKIIDIDQPIASRNLTDPTCVLQAADSLYLVTAESDLAWFHDQPYVTNVYKLELRM